MTKKGIQRASSDVGLIMVAYNLRRILNTLGKERLMDFLESIILHLAMILGLIPAIFQLKKTFNNYFYHIRLY